MIDRVRNFRGRVSNFNQSEARKHCFLASDRLKFEILPRKFRTLLDGTKQLTFANLERVFSQALAEGNGRTERKEEKNEPKPEFKLSKVVVVCGPNRLKRRPIY